MPAPAPTRILFLCTGNSARSILAEVLANARHGDQLWARSAGSHPRGTIHPLALKTLHANDLDTDGLASESVDVYADESFDLVVTLCASAAAEPCPAFPGAPRTIHWGLPDPPAAADPAQAFAAVFQTLAEALTLFATTLDEGIDIAAERTAEYIGRTVL